MARELVLDVVAKKNSRDLSVLADEFQRLAKEADGAGASLNRTGGFSKFVDEQLQKTRLEVERLGKEFENTGSKDVFASLRGAQANVKSLERIKTDLSNALSEGGQEGSKSIAASLQGVLSTPVLGPITAGALIAGGIAAAPIIGAAIGAAVSGAFALGGIGTGIFAQLKTNPAVQAEAHAFIDWIGAQFKDATASFAQPLENAFSVLKTDLAGPLRDLGKDFAYLAPYVEQFAMYLGAAVEKFMPGFNRMIQSSGPILTELGHDLVYVADGLNTMFDEISKGGKGEVEALDFLARGIGATLAATGFFIRGMSAVFDALVRVDNAFLKFADDWLGWEPIVMLVDHLGIPKIVDGISRSFDGGGASVSGMARSLVALGGALSDADFSKLSSQISQASGQMADLAGQTSTLAAAMSQRLFSSVFTADEAVIGWHRSLLNLHDTLAANGDAIDKHTHLISLNTKAGLDNREALLQAMQANMAIYQSQVAVGVSSADAAKQYDANTRAVYAMGHQMHLTDDQIHDVIGSLQGIPAKTELVIATEGLTQAINDLGDLIRLINGLHGKTIDIVTRNIMINQINAPGSFGNPNYMGSIRRAAFGMIVGPSNPGTLIGEPQTGGEALIPLKGISQSRAAALGRIAMAGYGLDVVGPRTGTRRLSLAMSASGGGTGLNAALMSWFLSAVKNGDIQLEAGGTTVTVA